MTHVTCTLTATNRDQLRNPTLSNLVWATVPFLNVEIEQINKAKMARVRVSRVRVMD